jgi:RNase P/RNase MRP subunit p30
MKNQIILSEKNFSRLKEQVKKAKQENKEKTIIFTSNDDELNRKLLEKLDIDVLIINLSNRKDFQKQRNSGFNQVLAKLAKKKNITIGINLDEIINTKNLKEKSELLARIKQNIMLCNKNKLKMIFIAKEKNNQRNKQELKSLGSVLGMPTWMLVE